MNTFYDDLFSNQNYFSDNFLNLENIRPFKRSCHLIDYEMYKFVNF